ncbi:hypothetical protein HUJ05_009418 [Dendroctonus ponderosae]|nr:hypothetical protein HUJ05_009418 [Dendroctonus ponderosae]
MLYLKVVCLVLMAFHATPGAHKLVEGAQAQIVEPIELEHVARRARSLGGGGGGGGSMLGGGSPETHRIDPTPHDANNLNPKNRSAKKTGSMVSTAEDVECTRKEGHRVSSSGSKPLGIPDLNPRVLRIFLIAACS